MLACLRIKNLALVADLTLEFQPGLNVITGETGAGKSILIGGLSLVLGERADRNWIRSCSEGCTVEAVFDTQGIKAPLREFLEENGLESGEDGQLVLKRAFTNAGSNRQFINGSPTTLTVLASLGEWLVDIHGPHDHQSLLNPARQLAVLDAFGNLDKPRDQWSALIRKRAELESQKAELVVDEKTHAQRLDLLRFQAREIGAARLDPAEEESLQQDYDRAHNAARLLELGQAAQTVLQEQENSLLEQAGLLGRTLFELQRLDPSAAALVETHGQAADAWRELQSALSRYLDRVELDPEHLQKLEERLNLIQALKRKYGNTLAEVIRFGEEAGRQCQQLEQREAELARIHATLQDLDRERIRCGRELSAQRRQVIPKLARAVVKHLADLGFRQSQFEISILTQDGEGSSGFHPSTSGFDTVEYQFAPNPGEPARPLRAIASSGELARVMLALKTVLAAEDQIPVLVFDEVDANVGGETARVVGEKMLRIAQQRQVFCVTHLAQVAACAQAHYLVSKDVQAGRTTSRVQRINGSDRVTELARMLGGKTDAARKLAESLL
jgi:DNA repair protein RecN (Recombination protein N)